MIRLVLTPETRNIIILCACSPALFTLITGKISSKKNSKEEAAEINYSPSQQKVNNNSQKNTRENVKHKNS